MTDEERERERRKQRRLEKLGTNNPRCPLCGETDWRCMEVHHVAGQARDSVTVTICANCHRKRTDEQKDHPSAGPRCDPLLDKIGHFLLALADLLRPILEKLTEYGRALIERARTDVFPEVQR
jgi:hypothetical protein